MNFFVFSWEERRTPAGRVQYVNKMTRAVQWDKPTRSAYDVNSEGRSNVEIPTATIGGVISEASPEQPHRQRLITTKSENGRLSSSFVLKGVGDQDRHRSTKSKSGHSKRVALDKDLKVNTTTSNSTEASNSGSASSPQGATAADRPVVDRQKYYMNRNLIHRVAADNFDRKTTTQGQVYFVNRITGQTTWNDPSLPTDSATGMVDLGPLPDGWEVRTTPSGKSYFVDHNTRTTQFAGKITKKLGILKDS